MPLVGEDKFFWASDYPHPDHPGNYLEELRHLTAPMTESGRRAILGKTWRGPTSSSLIRASALDCVPGFGGDGYSMMEVFDDIRTLLAVCRWLDRPVPDSLAPHRVA